MSLTSLSSSNRHTYKENGVKRCDLLINNYIRQFSVQKNKRFTVKNICLVKTRTFRMFQRKKQNMRTGKAKTGTVLVNQDVW